MMIRILGSTFGLVLLHAASGHLLAVAAAVKQQPLEPLVKFREFAHAY